jgi:hypothetical protein
MDATQLGITSGSAGRTDRQLSTVKGFRGGRGALTLWLSPEFNIGKRLCRAKIKSFFLQRLLQLGGKMLKLSEMDYAQKVMVYCIFNAQNIPDLQDFIPYRTAEHGEELYRELMESGFSPRPIDVQSAVAYLVSINADVRASAEAVKQ